MAHIARTAFRSRRVLFNVPADNDRFFEKARELILDSVTLDLEDGVAKENKGVARSKLVTRLQSGSQMSFAAASLFPNAGELLVRLNSLQTREELVEDLSALEKACAAERSHNETKKSGGKRDIKFRPTGFLLPKVETASYARLMNKWIDEIYGPEADISLLLAIETARGMVDLRDILQPPESRRRVEALIFASEDFCADTGIIRTPVATELLWARSRLVTFARAFNLQAIDMVCIQYKDRDQLLRECQDGIHLGFDGKQAIHPNQIGDIYQHFKPTPEAIDFARKVVDQSPSHEGRPFVLNGVVVDTPVVKWAENLLYALVSNPTFRMGQPKPPSV